MTNTFSQKQDPYFVSTKRAVIWTSIFNEPLQMLYYGFTAVILYRDLHASNFQLALYTMLKPLVAILSVYWSSIMQRGNQFGNKRLVSNIIFTGILARLPFFFVPLIENPWLMILSTSSYMMLSRGGLPAWMEVIKQNLPEEKRSKIFSYSAAFGYLEGILLSLGMGIALDTCEHAWKWLFPLTAGIGMLGIIFQAMIQQKLQPKIEPTITQNTQQQPFTSLKEYILSPWKESLTLLTTRADFLYFQFGFMLAGSAMMVLQPALPCFFVDYLKLSYTEIAIALSLCKGLGFAGTSPLWSRYLNRFDIYRTAALVFLTVCLFPLFLMSSLINPLFIYLAYFCYGIGQAGSHLTWHLSGTLFAKDEDSYPFSNVNVLTVGIRGAVVPPLGSLLSFIFGPIGTFVSSMALCFLAGKTMLHYGRLGVGSRPFPVMDKASS